MRPMHKASYHHRVADRESSTSVSTRESNKKTIIALLPAVYLAAKYLVLKILPSKYFYDSINIMQMLDDNTYYSTRDKSYQFAASIFSKLGFLRLTSINEWHILLGMIFTAVFMLLILDAREPDNKESVYLMAAFGLLEIYVFTISKELCQFIIYCLIIISYRLLSHNKVPLVIFTTLILILEGITFRTYYVLIALLFTSITTLLHTSKTGGENEEKKTLISIIALLTGLIFIVMIGSFFFAKSYYLQLATVRMSTNGFRIDSADARTIIDNLYRPDAVVNSPIVLYINYIINALRMLFPLELLTKGPIYVPFCIYQLATTYYMIRALANALDTGNWELCFFLAIYLAYFSVSVMFEPDFGSWVRHDVSTFPVLLHLIVPSSIKCSPVGVRSYCRKQLQQGGTCIEESNACLRN